MRGKGGLRPTARVLVVVAALAGMLLGGAAARADDPDALHREAGRLADENAGLLAAEEAALLELFGLEARLGRATERAADLRAELADVVLRESAARTELELARQAEATAEEQLAERLLALYVEGEPDPISILLGASTLSDAVDGLDQIERVAQEDERILAQVEEARAAHRAALEALRDEAARVRRLAAAADASAAALAAARNEKAVYLEQLASRRELKARQIESLRARAAEAERKAAEIQSQADRSRVEPSPPPQSTPPASSGTTSEAPGGGRLVTVSATSYCLRGTTATGIPVRHGVIATDPAYIPLGTRMYVPGYGEGVAADTGGAVKGWTIDVWIESCAAVAAWGRKSLTITIYD